MPPTYVPARNTVLCSLALAWAETLGAYDLFLGVNVLDASGYPDCRPEFVAAFEALANLATRAGTSGGRFTVHAPLIAMTKADIIRAGTALGVDYGITHSCYDPAADGAACGRCDACQLRARGFREAGVPDPTRYQCKLLRGSRSPGHVRLDMGSRSRSVTGPRSPTCTRPTCRPAACSPRVVSGAYRAWPSATSRRPHLDMGSDRFPAARWNPLPRGSSSTRRPSLRPDSR